MLEPWKKFCSRFLVRWLENDHSTSAAAIAFYVIFSLAPILVFSIAIAGEVLENSDTAKAEAITFLNNSLGEMENSDGVTYGELIVRQVKTTAFRDSSLFRTITLCVIAVWSASATFVQLRNALNRINGFAAETVREGVIAVLLGRVRATVFSIGVGLLLAVATLLSAWSHTVFVKTPLLGFINPSKPDWLPTMAISWLTVMAIFFAMLRFLPMRRPPWREVLCGSIIGTVLFQLGKYLLIPLASENVVAEAYVASSALVITVMWIFLSTHVLLFAAEIGHMLFSPATTPFEKYKLKPKQ